MSEYTEHFIIAACVTAIVFAAVSNHVIYRWHKGYWSIFSVSLALCTLCVFPFKYYKLVRKERIYKKKVKAMGDIRERLNAPFIKDQNRKKFK